MRKFLIVFLLMGIFSCETREHGDLIDKVEEKLFLDMNDANSYEFVSFEVTSQKTMEDYYMDKIYSERRRRNSFQEQKDKVVEANLGKPDSEKRGYRYNDYYDDISFYDEVVEDATKNIERFERLIKNHGSRPYHTKAKYRFRENNSSGNKVLRKKSVSINHSEDKVSIY
ncbi:hypothetical protein NE848_12825 [Gramella jeungdoensis]|uniref:Lipoprotein n=1 Tax=Gramella jeungdoensis TaxID=708091 RepID=A0ABT0Z4X5_9FLAO|nr:hypothetical protein [Gramella jeungdoensis]MCM8570270.1 hypothetical protein [Gramella jeungdoensis]